MAADEGSGWGGKRRGAGRPKGKNFTRRTQVDMTETDNEMLEWLAEFLGTSKMDAARTAIRSFAAQMQQLDRDLRGRRFEK